MALTIKNVEKKSLCERMGFLPGDRIEAINGHPINDIIDFQYYSADEILNCALLRNGTTIRVHLKRSNESLGLDFEAMRYRACGNQCIFCFVDQNPKGLRRSLYFKDEDYRLSFLHGNYVTLTHVKQRDLHRIVEQRLSPLYVSIHATDTAIRKILLGLDRDDHLMEKLKYLVNNGIQLHGQIVLCPGINDGAVLKESLETLAPLFPRLRSMAVVPVGLTRHRSLLPKLSTYNVQTAKSVIQRVQTLQKKYEKKYGDPFVYLADEFYLMTGTPLPGCDHYGEFWQVENGVGMTSLFLAEFEEDAEHFPERLRKPQHIRIVTGTLAGPVLQEKILPRLSRIGNLQVEIKHVINRFYGDSVTVSGLLTGRDIIDSMRSVNAHTTLLLPANCLNRDGLFLDDLTPDDIAEPLDCRIRVIHGFGELWSRR